MASVALIGPDGAGKTTIARMLERSSPLPVKYLYMGVNTESSNLSLPTSRLVNRVKRKRADARHQGVPRKRGPLWVGARLVHHLAEEGFRQLACWYYELSGRVVLCDRHFVFDYSPEITADTKDAFDRRARRWVFMHLYPHPDLVIYLDAPGDVLFARKGDATAGELERRRRAYLSQGSRTPNFVSVDATRPLDEVYELVSEHILRFLPAATPGARMGGTRIASRFDELRSRYFYRALDASTTADVYHPQREAPSLSSALRRRSSTYERVRGLVSAMDRLVPGTIQRIRRTLMHSTRLPLEGVVEVLAFGSGSTVYRLRGAGPERAVGTSVLKVYRRSLGRRLPAVLELAEEFRAKYCTISAWYDGCSVVLPTHFAVVHAPILGRPAVACMQPYIAEEKLDVFASTDAELIALLGAHAWLRKQFCAFAECTLRVVEQEGRCVDLLGPGNLVLIDDDGVYRLCLLDFGIFDLAKQQRDAPRVAVRITELMQRIRSLLDAAGRMETRETNPMLREIAN